MGFEVRITRLGHVQRGGDPMVFDRLLGTRLAAYAVDQLDNGVQGVLIGLTKGRISVTPLSEVASGKKDIDLSLLNMAKRLAK